MVYLATLLVAQAVQGDVTFGQQRILNYKGFRKEKS